MKKHSVGKSVKSHKKDTAHKPKKHSIAIKPKHAKPYRKRHYGGLVLLILLGMLMFAFVVSYKSNLQSSLQSAQDFIAQNFGGKITSNQDVSSTYGYNFSYNPQEYYVSAIDSATGAVILGDDLSSDRAYESIRVSPTWVQDDKDQNSMTIDYLKNETAKGSTQKELADLEAKLVVNKPNPNGATVTKVTSNTRSIDGVLFLRSDWVLTPKDKIASSFISKYTTLVAVVNDKPMVIKINQGFAPDEYIEGLLGIVNSMTFGPRTVSSAPVNQEVDQKITASRSALDAVLMTQSAEAAEKAPTGASEYVSALYSPAVIKIFNVYCKDISVNGKPYIQNACEGSTGSGFFVSSDGYIATNGHVATSNPKDLVILNAVKELSKGNQTYFDDLVALAKITNADIAVAKDEKEQADIIINKFYEIDDSVFTTTNSVTNLIVCLSEKQPEVSEIVTLTKARKEYGNQSTMKRAEIVSSDFRWVDGISRFYASDVALLKIEGSNYPTTKLGTIGEVSQGSGLNILGFPGSAGKNGLVDSEQSKSTLTTGKVSSVKNATGSDNKLIETDTTIGHGNSGGPVFAESNSVVGIATYTIDGSGKGDGVFNYIRDIDDFKQLASKANVNTEKPGETQDEWQKGIDLFYKARYSKALNNFKKVKELYPAHPKAAEFIANAELKIKNGEDVKDFPMVLIVIGSIAIIAGIAGTIFVIIRHNSKHQLYKVASGQAVPTPTGFNAPASSTVSIPGIPGQSPAPQQNPTYGPQPPVQPMQPNAYPQQPQASSAPQPNQTYGPQPPINPQTPQSF